DALEKVLETVNALPHERLFCVFGCGGDRDKGKRPVMGEIAARLSDVPIVTDDNPRSEDPEQIIDQILAGMQSRARETDPENLLGEGGLNTSATVVIRDRRQAIEAAIRAASSNDIVVIAGKGHEPYQLTLGGKRFFDDRLEARRVVSSWTAEQVCAAVSGAVVVGEASSRLLGRVQTDSRTRSRNAIFVALKGDTHDAHVFAPQAVANGASCLVVDRPLSLGLDSTCCQIQVEDTLQALGDLASFRRRRLAKICDQVVIGLTGSCGKTTVKEMTAAILESKWPEGPDFPKGCVLKTQGNFNNLVGLPLSLLPLDVHHRAAVMEMGMNRPGELRRLGEIADPDVSCITNIHGAHLEGLASIDGVARAKEELFAVTRKDGILVVNLDDSRVKKAASTYANRKISFSVSGGEEMPEADLWSSGVRLEKNGRIAFTLHYGPATVEISLQAAGEHNVSNALCAAAISLAAGANLDHVQAGLANFRPPDKRMVMEKAGTGFSLINDTYNANPASMTAGLKTLRLMAGRNAVAVIGDMLELGNAAQDAHYGIGRLIAELGIDYVGVVGEFKGDVIRGALDHGFDKECIRGFADKESAGGWVKELVGRKILGQDDLVLVKASRGLRFETIVAKLID
ncbi:MAG: UDP-N-acetylmuramoyl-tripeptide--D-alanyl-D-alanine ligase, partial [Desulforhopalus sp.]